MRYKKELLNYTLNKRNRILKDYESCLLLLAFCDRSILNFIVLAISRMPIIGNISLIIRPLVYGMLFFYANKGKKITVKIKEFLVFLLLVVFFSITYIFYPVNIPYIIVRFKPVILPAILFFILGITVTIDSYKMRLLSKISYLALLINILYVNYAMLKGKFGEDNMSLAYDILPNILFIYNYFFYKKNISSCIFSLLGIIFVFSLGTRGPVVILCSFIIISIWRKSKMKFFMKVFLLIILIGIAFSFYTIGLYGYIIKNLIILFDMLDLSTRNLNKLLNGEFISYTSGRNILYKIAISKILERPFLGYGIYGEWQWFNYNVHNIYLEVLIHYGVVLGLFILIWTFRQVRKAYLVTKDSSIKDMIIIWSVFVIVRGIFGGEYLSYSTFFLIGLCIKEQQRVRKYNRRKKKYD